MRFLLRHREHGRYWTGEKWSDNSSEALAFSSVLDALAFRKKHQLSGAEAVSAESLVWASSGSLGKAATVRLFHEFLLFLHSTSVSSENAEDTLRNFCAKFLEPQFYSIHVFALPGDARQFMDYHVLGTPTLILRQGKLVRRLVGNFTSVDLVRFCVLNPGIETRPRAANRKQN